MGTARTKIPGKAAKLLCCSLLLWLLLPGPALEQGPRPNILILSFCSVRQDHLTPWGYSRDTTPNLEEFARHAYVFRNTFTNLSWTNATTFVKGLGKWYFRNFGYNLPGLYAGGRFLRVPRIKGLELDYEPGMTYLKQLLLSKRHEPFYLGVHIKYQHFPYFDFMHSSFDPGTFMSPSARALLTKYRANPGAYPDKLSMMTLLFRDPDLILKNPYIVKEMKEAPGKFNPKEPYGIINNPEFIERWKKSKGYKEDLALLQEVYDAKLHYLDGLLKEVLNLYGDPELQKNTIVIFVGDHGEAFMDHDYLLHGDTVYDEVLRSPMMVRFPGTPLQQPRYIDQQMFQGSVRTMIEAMIKGLDEPHFEPFLRRIAPENSVVVARDCRDTERAIRVDNRWKLIVNLVTREERLFDLQADPEERKDVFKKHLDVAGHLEEQLLEMAPDAFQNRYNPNCVRGNSNVD